MSLKKQASIQNQMTRHVSFCKAVPDNSTLSLLQLRLQQVKKLYEDFETNQEAIEETFPEERLDESYVVRTQMEEYYYFCHSKLQECINYLNDRKERTEGSQGSKNGNSTRQEVKLPRIELIPFSGKYEDWTSFKDLYTSLIHNNNSISDVQKLHYLKTNVQGDAESLLKSITVTEANYKEAWKKLTERYDHKRFIVDSLLKSFFNQHKITSENHKDIKQLIDKSSEIIQSLKIQGIPVGHWDAILIHVIVSKLDPETHKEWGLKQKKDDLPKYKELEEFLRLRWQSLEMIVTESEVKSQPGVQRTQSFGSKSASFLSTTEHNNRKSITKCFYCQDSSHKIISCSRYSILNTSDKINFIKSNRLCFNCLASGHSSSNCTSIGRCKICKSKHHTIIHNENKNSTVNNSQSNSNSTETANKTTVTAVNSTNASNKRVLLATAIVFVYSSSGEKYPAKTLIDLGSDNTVIVGKLATKLGLTKVPDHSKIRGLGDTEVSTRNSSVKFRISSHVDSTFSTEISATVMEKVTGNLPMVPIHREDWTHLRGLKLADPHYDCPSPVEILLGADTYEEILLDGLIKKRNDSPTAQNSRLGWLLFGVVKTKPEVIQENSTKIGLFSSKSDQLDNLLKTFWEIEEVPEQRKLTVKERQAEEIFVESVHKNNEGRYEVALPFDPEKESLDIGESKKAALASLFRMEGRFKKDKLLKERYQSYFKNLISAGHIELVPTERMDLHDKDKFYLPHHAVMKEESLTTKLRVVFNASWKSSTGISLNDKLLIGPKTQEDLFSILIRWRKHLFVMLADIEKMYRQIKLTTEHRDFQRILWRFNDNEPISEYRITTVIDGTASASFLATRTLN